MHQSEHATLHQPASCTRRRCLGWLAAGPLGLLQACGGGAAADSTANPALVDGGGNASPSRSWALGFSRIAPRADLDSLTRSLTLMRGRAEFVLMQEHLPWAELLAGVAAADLVARDLVPLAGMARAQGLGIVFLAEFSDGVSRGEEPAGLRATGRRLAEPAVQALALGWLREVARQLQPQRLGLATETNAVRLLAPADTYDAMVRLANQGAAALRADGYNGELMVSAQVEVAWGLLGRAGPTPYVGLARDRADFAFAQVLGLSSYPYFVHSQPEDIAADYYRRPVDGWLPALVVEGGWPSRGDNGLPGSPQLQARYLQRQAQLLDSVSARGAAQLLLADLDLAAQPPAAQASLAPFASLGLLDSAFGAKPALAAWDALHARPLASG